jgi:hypothetical protein
MNKLILAVGIAVCAGSVLAQGTITFGNHIGGSVMAPIYGRSPADLNVNQMTGNTAAGIPAGSALYTGAMLAGDAYDVQLWAGPDAGSLAAVSTVRHFGPGNGAGYFASSTETIPTVAGGQIAILQVRAWDNLGGAATTWDQAVAANADLGMSMYFASQPLGGGIIAPPNMIGLTSFNIHLIPEPTVFALAGLGAALLLMFRRRP